ncbi:MAG TPA: hydantoinase/oxoprolinase family protein, partial [Candidatus Fraserbacteria bacterium]|nr:hydantoinase/oxoprolinase family protein [Candidatus Fraserbacteria bacterium]
LVAFDPRSGRLETLKLSSTPQNPAQAVLQGLQALLDKLDCKPTEIGQLVHGTTVATNALLEGKWARTALITTEGFRDVLEIGRQSRPELYNFFTQRSEPLVPRHLRYEILERLDFRGQVLRALEEGGIQKIAAKLSEEEVESVAVVLLFSYLNPSHERRVRELLGAQLQDLPIVLSCETLPEYREYERTSTTVMNAALLPVVNHYLQELEEGTQQLGVPTKWRVMQSNAGITSARLARQAPVTLLLSGPAGGVEGARFIGELTGHPDLITLDMGGTSCDLSLIQGGRPRLTSEGQIAGRPLRVPMVDIQTIGAGGGSIAWLDAGGALRVGPKSAGALPGPVGYGRGGTEPTVTDAQLVLGRLNPQSPLGDIPRLDLEAARRAIAEQIAQPLEMSLEEAASGILTVSEANMERAIRVISVERGYDPRVFALLAFGGAGPLHAGQLARRLGIPTVIVPGSAGVLSAFGLLTADLIHHFVQTVLQSAQTLDWEQVNRIYQEFKREGRRRLQADSVRPEQIAFVPSMDLRYLGQSYELSLTVPDRSLGTADLAELAARFHREHERVYGHAAREEPLELVNLRMMAVGTGAKPVLPRRAPGRKAPEMLGKRPVYFAGTGWEDCPFYGREGLAAPARLEGPAILEGVESTVVIYPGQSAQVDAYGQLIVEVS